MGNTMDTVRDATNREVTVVSGEVLHVTAGTVADAALGVDQAFGTTPTLGITLSSTMPNKQVTKFLLTEVQYHLNPTNAVTYTLYLLEASNADDMESSSDVVFETASAQADDIRYHHVQAGFGTTASYKLPVVCELENLNKLWYLIDWSGAPGSITGYIKVKGQLLK